MELDNLRNYVYNLLQRRDYSESEIKDKAKIKGYLPADINQILSELKQKNFVNDVRLAENVVLAYEGKKGKMWLRQKLAMRKIPASIIENVLNSEESPILSPDKTVKEKLERRYEIKNWSELDQNTKQKVVRFLQGQGFSQPFAILKQWVSEK